MIEDLTKEEKKAIRSMIRLAKNWPKTLSLIHHGDGIGISIKHIADLGDDPANAQELAWVNIKSDSCA